MESLASSLDHHRPLGSDVSVMDSNTDLNDIVIKQEENDNCTEGQILDAVKTEVDDEINHEHSLESDLRKIDKIIHDFLNYDKHNNEKVLHNLEEDLTDASIKIEPQNDDFNSISDNKDLAGTKTDASCVKDEVDDIQGGKNDDKTKVEVNDTANLSILNLENSTIASSVRNNDVLESNEKDRRESGTTRANSSSKMNASNDKPSCDICGYKSKNMELFMEHLRAHAKGKLKLLSCDSCNYKTVFKGRLVIHMKRHTENKMYCCDICGKKMNTRSSFLRHISLHKGNRPYACDVCDKTFSESGSLNAHLRRHRGEKPYKCHMCDKSFVESGSLSRHVRSHTGEKLHSCTICNRKFSVTYSLKIHMSVHTEDRKFSCELCLKMFKSKHALHRHMKFTHSAVKANAVLKTFTCDVCGKVVHRRTGLVNHLKTHSNEKPFLCTICNKSFGYKPGLQKHMKIHFARETVTCHACNKSFIERDNLVKHLKLYCHGVKG